MKLLMPIGIAILGLGVGVGAGVALKPQPEEQAAVEPVACAEGDETCTPEAPDPFAPVAVAKPKIEGETLNVPMDKPFVVPIFKDDRVVAMIVASIAMDIQSTGATAAEAVQPRLRDTFLGVMFQHANSGGFDGTFTEGRKMSDLRSALLGAAQTVFGETAVYDVLITDIVRQDI